MDTTPRPDDASLQASLRHLRRMAAGAALALALLGAAAGLAAPADAAAGGEAPERFVMTANTRKVNEYEGQHRLGAGQPVVSVRIGDDPPDPPVPPGFAPGKAGEIAGSR